MNRIIVMGRLTRDPEVRYSAGDNPYAITKYTLAVDRRQRNGKETAADFIPCTAFRGAGEFAEKYFRKGMRVLVSGRLEVNSYLNNNGDKVTGFSVIVDEQEFADSKTNNDENKNNGGYQNGGANLSSDTDGDDGFMNIPDGVEDEGLPFN